MVFYAVLTAQRSSERCVARAAGRGACYISRWGGRAGGDAAAPVIELRTAPFRCHSENASGQPR